MANETEILDLRTHADNRIKSHGTNALLKVRATLCRDIVNSLMGAQTKAAKAEAPLDDDESAELTKMREERDAATSALATAEGELRPLRGVVEAFEKGKKKDVTAANKAYRDEFPAATGNTAERAPEPVPEPDEDPGADPDSAEGDDDAGADGADTE